MYPPTFAGPHRIHSRIRSGEMPVERPVTAEAELVRRLCAGDEAAFRELIECFGPKIYRITYGILRNRDDADDIAQEVFARVYFSIKRFEGRSALSTWISRIAINECYGYLRKKQPVYESTYPDGRLLMHMQNVADPRPRADLAAMQRDLINKLLTDLGRGAPPDYLETSRWIVSGGVI